MNEIVFESQLLKNGHLYCPKKYATNRAKFKVIVSMPDQSATDSEIELASVIDNSDEFLSKGELNYYMNLDREADGVGCIFTKRRKKSTDKRFFDQNKANQFI